METQKLRTQFLLILLVVIAALAAVIFSPFLKPLVLAAVFAVVLQGLYRAVQRVFAWPGLAAFFTIIIATVVILLPLSLVGVLVAREARSLYTSLEAGSGQALLEEVITRADAALGGFGIAFSQAFSTDLSAYVKQALSWIVEHAGAIFGSISGLLLSLFIFFIALYYLLRDGPAVRRALIAFSPLNDSEDEAVLERLARAINSVIKGNLLIALLQGALSVVGFTLFGVPHALLWGMVTALAALVPGIGTAVVFAPAIAFLYFIGAAGSALGLLVWGVLAVGLVDNLLGPRLVGRGMQLHPLLVLLSVLGGLAFFGPSGVFLGPLTVTLLLALLSLYASGTRGTPVA